MKNHLFVPALLVVLLFTLGGCKTAPGSEKKTSSTGRAFEVIVVSPRSVWDGPVGDTLRAVLLRPVPMLNQREPHMDPVPLIPSAFMNIVTKHRNVIDIQIGEEYPALNMNVAPNVYAQPQLIVQITGPDEASVADYLWSQREELLEVFAIAERDRYVAYATRQAEKTIRERVREKFGFELSVPKGYAVGGDQDDFLLVSLELPLVSQGVVIYRYPYTGPDDFTPDSLIARRNAFTGRIPGPSEGSYMTTVNLPGLEPELEYLRLNGRAWAKLRGFWDVEGDYMGGPFVSYSTLDRATSQVICIDCYVFSPKHNKRNYIRELENLVHTVRFPDDPARE